MAKLVFEKYNTSDPYFDQKSNVVFMGLQSAILNTQEKPTTPKTLTEWKSMVTLLESFSSLETTIEETVSTPEGPRKVSIGILKPEGGEIEIDADTLKLLRTLWEAHVEKNLSFAQARMVILTNDFLDTVGQ